MCSMVVACTSHCIFQIITAIPMLKLSLKASRVIVPGSTKEKLVGEPDGGGVRTSSHKLRCSDSQGAAEILDYQKVLGAVGLIQQL